jgi:hypothetical protein
MPDFMACSCFFEKHRFGRRGLPSFLFLYLLGLCFFGQAQTSVSGLEFAISGGSVWRHTPRITTETGKALTIVEMGWRLQTMGRRAWHGRHHFPALGINWVGANLGEGNHGYSLGVLSYLDIPLFRHLRTGLFFRVGSGFAWVSRPYDFVTNSGQNAIGGHLNNLTQFRISGNFQLNPRYFLRLGLGGHHWSNAGSKLPNYGINVLNAQLALSCYLSPVVSDSQVHVRFEIVPERRLGVMLYGGGGLTEYGLPDGPVYFIRNATILGFCRWNTVHRSLLGLDYEFNPAVYRWGRHLSSFANLTEARRGATRIAAVFGHEFVFGKLGLSIQYSPYLGRVYNQFVLSRTYTKIGVRYYWPLGEVLGLVTGVSLKAHAATAEYASWFLGIIF